MWQQMGGNCGLRPATIDATGTARRLGMTATPAPQEVGVRALKNALSRYLAAVRDGQELIVTDHGKPVARIVPVSRSVDRLAELIAQGKVRPARPGPRYDPQPLENAGPLSDIVIEQRR